MPWTWEKWTTCNDLLRMVVSVYYSLDYYVVINSFLSLLQSANAALLQSHNLKGETLLIDESAKITESEITTHCSLGIRKIRAVLMRLRTDGLIKCKTLEPEKTQSKEGDVTISEMSISAKQQLLRAQRKALAQNQSKLTVYWVDWFLCIKKIKYNQMWIFNEITKRENSQSEEFYFCPTIGCQNNKLTVNLIDLLLKQANSNKAEFSCDLCYKEIDGKQIPTKLKRKDDNILIKQQDGTEVNNSLKSRFNKLISPIVLQLKLVDDILMEILLEAADQTINQTRQTLTGKHIAENKPNNNINNDEYKHGIRVLHKPGQVDVTSIQPLPWQSSVASLNQLHSIQQKQIQQEENERKLKEEREKKLKDQEEFNRRMKEEMKRQMELQQQSAPKAESAYFETENGQIPTTNSQSVEFEDPILRVAGVEFPLSAITSSEVTAMTDEEFAIYESYVNNDQDQFDDDGTFEV